ncbi:MAG TPA: metallophosphoesterase [Candidatus Saccharimonadia bacterium]|nr:metallophosphoesterase [Candidatus Saccharimonadia bacterium]
MLAGCQGLGVAPSRSSISPSPETSVSVTAGPSSGAATAPPPSATSPASVTLITAGDIARCDSQDDESTAALAATYPGTVLVLGDNVYENGSSREYQDCYQPSWGQRLDRTLAVPGNHDHHVPGAKGYFDYFGARAGPDKRGWYAQTLGAWRLITLDSECTVVGGCGERSPQYQWLTAELSENPTRCTVVAFHRPRYSSGYHGDYAPVDPLWRLVVDAGADIVLNGHEHSYERLGPMDADGRADPEGVDAFIVGTGGAALRGFKDIVQTSQVRIDDRHGVLVLQLADSAFDWAFHSTPDGVVEDRGTGTCH